MFRRVTAAAVIGVLCVLGFMTPAQAAPGCTSGWICFHNTSTSNPNYALDGEDTSPGECHNLPSSARNTTSYISNRTVYRWYVYAGLHCLTFPAGTIYAGTSGPMSGSWNENIESFKRG